MLFFSPGSLRAAKAIPCPEFPKRLWRRKAGTTWNPRAERYGYAYPTRLVATCGDSWNEVKADHVSPREVTPTLGKGTLGTWRFLLRARTRETVPGIQPTHRVRNEAVGKPRNRGVCEPALEPRRRWEGLWKKSQDFKPDRGKPAVRAAAGCTRATVSIWCIVWRRGARRRLDQDDPRLPEQFGLLKPSRTARLSPSVNMSEFLLPEKLA